MVKFELRAAAWLVVASLSLTACDKLRDLIPNSKPPPPAGVPEPKVGYAQFPDIPIPTGAKMIVERSLVLGTRDAWIGRLAMKIGRGASSVYDFYVREMGRFGWREITSVRSEVSVLTYGQTGRIATVQIWDTALGGAKIDITVSPRGKPAPDLGPKEPPPFK